MLIVQTVISLVVASVTCAFADIIRIPQDLPSVQAGLDSVGMNDTLLLESGVYEEVLIAPALRFWITGQTSDSVGGARAVIDATDIIEDDTTAALSIPPNAAVWIEDLDIRAIGKNGIRSWADTVVMNSCRVDSARVGFKSMNSGGQTYVKLRRCMFQRNILQCLNGGASFVLAEMCVFSGGSSAVAMVSADHSQFRISQFSSSNRAALLVLTNGPHLVSGCNFGPVTTQPFGNVVLAVNGPVRFEYNVFSACDYGSAVLNISSDVGDSLEVVGNRFASCRGIDDPPSALGVLTYIASNTVEHGPLIEGNIFSNCAGVTLADDIAADWTPQALIRDNVFHNDARNLLPSITAGNPEWQMPPLTLINNRWENSGYAVDLSAAADARNNYWGHNSGPYHALHNPEGRGDTISGEVPFIPWLIDSMDAVEFGPVVPQDVALRSHPNPFNMETQLTFSLAAPCVVRLALFDVLGRETRVLINERLTSGAHSVSLHADEFPSGVYFARLTSSQVSSVVKLILLK